MAQNKLKESYEETAELLGEFFQGTDISFYSVTKIVNAEAVELLSIKYNSENKSKIKRITTAIKALIGSKNKGIQKIIEVNEDEDNHCFYIVYEPLEESDEEKLTKHSFEQCINTLNELKIKNRNGFILNEHTIVKTSDNFIKIRFIGLFELFQIFDINFNEDIENKRNITDDIEALAKLFEDFLGESDEKKIIFEKCIKGDYKKYSELEKDIKDLPFENNPDFDNIGIRINEKKEEINIEGVLAYLNKGCFWIIKSSLSEKEDQITIKWSTDEVSGIAYVVVGKYADEGYLFIPHLNEYSDKSVLEKGEKACFNFEDAYDIYSIDYFTQEWEKNNELARLNKTKKNVIKTWQTLPEKEKEYIEEQAFKARYVERKMSNSRLNIVFILEDEFKDWDVVKKKKNEGVKLSIDDNFIGEILDYKQKENRLIIKDFEGEVESIPERGELIEDVQRDISQYKKQIEACEKFKNRDIVNPELASFLATPEKMPELPYIEIDYDVFKEKITSDDLKNDETQTKAVIDALHKKPIYLIQGPPGTGKTTVIVELVQQLIKQKKDVKILVVSQSNMAVDNVLERLPKEILFMRLASKRVTESDNIIPKIKPHLFEGKIKIWIDKIRKNSKDYLENIFPKIDKSLLSLYEKFALKKQEINNIEKFREFYRKQGLAVSYFEKKFEKANDLKDVDKIFLEELEKKFIKLKTIQKEWFSFIQNYKTTNNQNISKVKNGREYIGEKYISTLKNGSEDIDLQMAFVKSMNVFGATCIHIASSSYNKIDFKFDYMIMDESSKATSAEALVPITMSNNLVLIGDHKQLPPVVTREKVVKEKVKEELEDDGIDIEKAYGVSLFENLIEIFEDSNQLEEYKIMLDIQYRMPRQLGYLISKYIYDDKLKNPDLERLPEYDSSKSHHLSLKQPTVAINDEEVPNCIIFISTSKEKEPEDNNNKFKRSNPCNVDVIQSVLKKLNRCYKGGENTEVGIIAAYRGQVELLQQKIIKKEYPVFSNKIIIDTVDKFQGSERDIIIYDIVKSSKNKSNIGFLDDYRRINVAFSRAKNLLIVVGDSEYILKRAKPNPDTEIKEEDLVIRKMTQQLEEWGCIYDSIEEAINE